MRASGAIAWSALLIGTSGLSIYCVVASRPGASGRVGTWVRAHPEDVGMAGAVVIAGALSLKMGDAAYLAATLGLMAASALGLAGLASLVMSRRGQPSRRGWRVGFARNGLLMSGITGAGLALAPGSDDLTYYLALVGVALPGAAAAFVDFYLRGLGIWASMRNRKL